MKKFKSIFSLFAILSALSPSAAHAVDSCAAVFATSTAYDPATLLTYQIAGRAESRAFDRLGYAIEGTSTRELVEVRDGISYFKAVGQPRIYGGRSYIEFPNSTSATTLNSNGIRREFFLVRGVRDYKVGVNNQSLLLSPENYVSDVLLFERVKEKSIFLSLLLESSLET